MNSFPFSSFSFFFPWQIEFLGSSGHVRVNSHGERRDISLDIKQLTAFGSLELVGTWNTREGLMWRGVAEQHAKSNGKAGIRTELGEYLRKKDKTLVISVVLVSR